MSSEKCPNNPAVPKRFCTCLECSKPASPVTTGADISPEAVVCVTTERTPIDWEVRTKQWTVADLREVFPADSECVVDGLLKHIDALRSALTARVEHAAEVRKVVEDHCADLQKCVGLFALVKMDTTAIEMQRAIQELTAVLEKEPK